jgi:hypothetical protein
MSLGEKTSESFQANVKNNNLGRTNRMTNESTINYEGAGNPHAGQNRVYKKNVIALQRAIVRELPRV